MLKKIILDGYQLQNPEVAHPYLKEAFGFPEYYGQNLDALYDCLTEISGEMEIVIYDFQTENAYARKIYQVFLDAEEETEGLTVRVE